MNHLYGVVCTATDCYASVLNGWCDVEISKIANGKEEIQLMMQYLA
jgi:hypothetical protein